MPRAVDLTGQRFGMLVAIAFADKRDSHGRRLWLCLCSCGKEKLVAVADLTSGNSKSCGCLNNMPEQRHYMSNTPEHRAWSAIRGRCTPGNKSYKDYGARGIYVCERWQKFENFYADMGPRPSPDHSIDRIDNDGPYSPENCRWATQKEQNSNRRSVVLLTFNGKTLTASDWSRETGVPVPTICRRVKQGLPVEVCLQKGRINVRSMVV